MKPRNVPAKHADNHQSPRHQAARRVPYRDHSPQHRIPPETLLRSRRHRGAPPSGGDVGMDIDISCPACGRMDWVQSVPAVHSDGVSTNSGTNLYSGVGIVATGLVPVFGSATVERTHTTALARSLARCRRSRKSPG